MSMPEQESAEPVSLKQRIGDILRSQSPQAHERRIKESYARLVDRLSGRSREIGERLRPTVERGAKYAGISITAAEIIAGAAAFAGAVYVIGTRRGRDSVSRDAVVTQTAAQAAERLRQRERETVDGFLEAVNTRLNDPSAGRAQQLDTDGNRVGSVTSVVLGGGDDHWSALLARVANGPVAQSVVTFLEALLVDHDARHAQHIGLSLDRVGERPAIRVLRDTDFAEWDFEAFQRAWDKGNMFLFTGGENVTPPKLPVGDVCDVLDGALKVISSLAVDPRQTRTRNRWFIQNWGFKEIRPGEE